ncbi:unnamed protein product [Mytilus coruscus]|uniref:SGNH hydrolase-type esterase domain-containing protein n=1 Tax=Mytilus coruscus TaxID=42192 RepID=A0A6J8E0K1_MYTCO|nr:unnamed protein product [Mytilus coruscus]
MELQKNSQDKRIKDLQSDISDLQIKLNDKISKIEEMASSFDSVSENLKQKEDEVLSLKLHLSQDNTNNFQEELQVTPDILVLHSLSNAVRTASNENSIESLGTIIDHAREKFEDAKIIISLPTPRADEESLNNKAQFLSLMVKEEFRNKTNVELADNSNMAFKGSALQKYLDPKDNYHLSYNGTKMLASNIRDTIDKILGLPPENYHETKPIQFYTPRGQRDNTNDFALDDDSQ